MMFDAETPVATIVLDHSECAAVLARHQIDYCCVGGRALADACRERHVDVDSVIGELEVAVKRRAARSIDAGPLPTRQLIKEVIGRHHRYLHRTLPFLSTLVAKVVRLHAEREPSLLRVRDLVESLRVVLTEHLHEEEHVLFPALLGDEAGDVSDLFRAMASDHELATGLLAALRTATADFQAPPWACAGYRALMRELAELEADTLQHLAVEDRVLRPRFVAAL
jgi:regulator of cell morphogenesis and NO signaling